MTMPVIKMESETEGNGTWGEVSLGEILQTCQYGTSCASDAEGNVPIVGMKDLVAGYVTIDDTVRTNASPDELAQYSLKRNDILFNRTNSIALVGKAGIVREDSEAVFASYLVRLTVDPEQYCAKFLNYFLGTATAQELILQLATRGVSQANINPTQLRKRMRVPLPPLSEQEAIVDVLDAAEGAVQAADALIERKLAYKKALSEDLLTGRRRFPGFTLPWRETKLAEVFEPKDDRAPTKTPVILSCSKVYGILLQSDRFSKQLASVNNGHYKHVVPGDLVYDPMLLWDASISFTQLEGIVSPAYETLRWIGDVQADRRFFKALFQSEAMRRVYKRISQGTNARRRKAPVTDFLRVTLPMPNLDEQGRIADVLGAVEAEIVLLRKERETLNEQKKGLMQKLLTGEVRLKEFQ